VKEPSLRSTKSRNVPSPIPHGLNRLAATPKTYNHFVEKALVEELGPLGWRLHTGRSRNELVATDVRLFVICRRRTN